MLFVMSRLWRHLLRAIRVRPGRTALAVSLLMVISLLANALAFWWFDGQIKPDIGFGDALWYSLISVTTIGYGDFSATTGPARWATTLAIVFVGLPVFGAFMGIIADQAVAYHERERKGMLPVHDTGHLLILNCPTPQRVRDIAEEFRADPQHQGRAIYLVTDKLDQNPLSEAEIGFVKGSPIDEEVLNQANIAQAATVIVLSPDYGAPESDSQVAAAITLAEGLNPGIRTIAECLDERHRYLFTSAKTDAVIFPLRMANNAIVQVSQDPGVGQYLDRVLANTEGESLYSTLVPAELRTQGTYLEVARALLDTGVVLQAVMNEGEMTMELGKREVRAGDRLIYHAAERLDEHQLAALIGEA